MKLFFTRLQPAMMLCASSLLMTGCETMKPPTPTIATTVNPAAVCAVWPHMDYSGKDDSEATKREIIATNRARKAYCP